MYTLRNATESDAPRLRRLAQLCPPLDVHTPYTYWVLAKYHGKSSFVLEQDGRPVGFITALEAPSAVFIWQIGILPDHRGQGLSYRLIDAVLGYARGVSKPLEVTIAADNDASNAAFTGACQKASAALEALDRVVVTDLDDPDFEEAEIRYRITL